MKTRLAAAAIALVLANAVPAHASAISLEVGNYTVAGIFPLAINPSAAVSGLEASAAAYARDRGTLFFVGDEGTGVVEISLTGQTIGAMAFGNWPAASTNHDTEGLTYLGGGELVFAEERLQDLFRFTYLAGGTLNVSTTPFVSVGPGPAGVGNNGTEGVSYDPRNGNFVSVKQVSPEELKIFQALTFSTVPAADAVPNTRKSIVSATC